MGSCLLPAVRLGSTRAAFARLSILSLSSARGTHPAAASPSAGYYTQPPPPPRPPPMPEPTLRALASSSFILHPRLPGKVCLAFRLGFHFLDYSLPRRPVQRYFVHFFFVYFTFLLQFCYHPAVYWRLAGANEHVTPLLAFRFYYYALAHIPAKSAKK